MNFNNNIPGYLMVHFIGEQPDGEQVYFAISEDGLHWKDLNKGKPVLYSELGEKGVRDPFILRSPKENKFYLIATDLCIGNGMSWKDASSVGSRDIIIWESQDLVNWSSPWSVTLAVPGAGCAWAPEAIYDEVADNFLVFWASATQEPNEEKRKQKIYCSRTRDFRSFTATEKYIEREDNIIDTTIVAHNGNYYRFSLDDLTRGIMVEKGVSLNNDSFKVMNTPELKKLIGVEGPQVFKFNDREEWCLIVDRSGEAKGYLPVLISNLDKGVFQICPEGTFNMGENKKRHGSVLSITANERTRLLSAFGD